MGNCQFYQLVTITTQRRPISTKTYPTNTQSNPWCSHPHSPVPEDIAKAPTGQSALKCDGEFPEKCQVREEVRYDFGG